MNNFFTYMYSVIYCLQCYFAQKPLSKKVDCGSNINNSKGLLLLLINLATLFIKTSMHIANINKSNSHLQFP